MRDPIFPIYPSACSLSSPCVLLSGNFSSHFIHFSSSAVLLLSSSHFLDLLHLSLPHPLCSHCLLLTYPELFVLPQLLSNLESDGRHVLRYLCDTHPNRKSSLENTYPFKKKQSNLASSQSKQHKAKFKLTNCTIQL